MPVINSSRAPSVDCFPANYASARDAWLDAVARLMLPAEKQTYRLDGLSPEGAALTTDTAWIGPLNAPCVLVVIGGTHGIEGYAGSAVLCDLLRQLGDSLPAGLALLCIHALNPWGYAWHRRCDAEGIDLNRNFIDFSQPAPDNPGYRELRDALFDANASRRQQALDAYREAHGQRAFEIAISGGQYCDPDGPFYGGVKAAHGRLSIETLIERYALGERRLGVIDVHTGLGPWAYGEIICDHEPESAGAATARAWYGEECTLPALGTSSSVPKLGLLDYAWHAIMQGNSCYITLEFGTLPTAGLFDVLLRDHRFHAEHGARAFSHPDYAALVADMQAHFCPQDERWREAVLVRARAVIERALAGLSS